MNKILTVTLYIKVEKSPTSSLRFRVVCHCQFAYSKMKNADNESYIEMQQKYKNGSYRLQYGVTSIGIVTYKNRSKMHGIKRYKNPYTLDYYESFSKCLEPKKPWLKLCPEFQGRQLKTDKGEQESIFQTLMSLTNQP